MGSAATLEQALQEELEIGSPLDLVDTRGAAEGVADIGPIAGPPLLVGITGSEEQPLLVEAFFGRQDEDRSPIVDAGEVEEVGILTIAVRILLPSRVQHRDAGTQRLD
jgi:hypothetical protein